LRAKHLQDTIKDIVVFGYIFLGVTFAAIAPLGGDHIWLMHVCECKNSVDSQMVDAKDKIRDNA
jgi:hypothetical protein